jgi:23S rRNA pseudouridine955/2504/2580 synthase
MIIPDEASGERLDRFIQRQSGQPFSVVQRWIRTGQVRLDGKRSRANTRLVAGGELRLPPFAASGTPTHQTRPKATELEAAQAFLDKARVYEDATLLVINKPAGLAVQGGSGTVRHLDALLRGLTPRPLLVHRLDRDTSGLLLLAKSRLAARVLTADFRSQRIRKTYWAVVAGVPQGDSGRIALPLTKRPIGGQERVVVDVNAGLEAVTLWRKLATEAGLSWLELRPLTGRTHQLRVHSAAHGWPILGDSKYGAASAQSGKPSLFLHARSLSFTHPERQQRVEFTAPCPPAFAARLEAFGASVDGALDFSAQGVSG